MSVLITNDFQTFDENANKFRVVILTNGSNRPEASERTNRIKAANGMRLRKGTLRVFEGDFSVHDLYPAKFNNYTIILRAHSGNIRIYKDLETIFVTLASLNKSATVMVRGWNNIVKRTARFNRPSMYIELFNKYNGEVRNEADATGTIVCKIVKV